MKIKEKILNVSKEQKIFLILALIVIIQVIWLISSHDSYAYYSSSNEIPILSTKIGNFAGGDTSELKTNTDINLLYYAQDIADTSKYNIVATPPIDNKNYKLDEKRSNCIPKASEKEGDNVSYSDYSIDETTGEVKITVTEDNIHQIVCRIYYSFELDPYTELNRDINVIALVESSDGLIATVKDTKKYVLKEIPTSGYKLGSYECTNKDEATQTQITYKNGNLQVDYKVKDLCYLYFDKDVEE